MAVSKSQLAAQMRYNAKTYEQVNIQVKKGVKGEWKQAAAARGLGLMEMVRTGVNEYIANHPVIDKGE